MGAAHTPYNFTDKNNENNIIMSNIWVDVG